jgi:hypothetical protein
MPKDERHALASTLVESICNLADNVKTPTTAKTAGVDQFPEELVAALEELLSAAKKLALLSSGKFDEWFLKDCGIAPLTTRRGKILPT